MLPFEVLTVSLLSSLLREPSLVSHLYVEGFRVCEEVAACFYG